MRWEDRGHGLLGLVRWELFCFGIDPALIIAEDILRALANKGAKGWTLDTVIAETPADRVADDRALAIAIARTICNTMKNPASPEPVRVHWFTAKRV